jgi:hypothetical protein
MVRPWAISDHFAQHGDSGNSKTIERKHTMKKYTLMITLIAAVSVGGGFAADPTYSAKPSASPSATADGGGGRCNRSSASVEVHGFFGTKETVTEKVATLPVNLLERRVFLQVTQSSGTNAKTVVKLFEQKEDSSYAVTEWTKGADARLMEKIDEAIIKNKGKECVGEVTRKLLERKLGEGKTVAPLAAPGSPKDAFSSSVSEASGDCIKSTIIILC